MTADYAAARDFVRHTARLLDQRAFAARFEDGDPSGVVAAVAAYRNADGGFGHGLEPDKRAPSSQPLDVEIAFEYLAAVSTTAMPEMHELVTAACDWLASIATPEGAVAPVLPSIEGFPRAAHWQGTDHPPGLNPTAAIAAHGHRLGVAHPWIERATEYALAEIEAGRIPAEAHALLTVAKLADVAPDRRRAAAVGDAIAAALPTATFLKLDPASDDYGVTPLDFAPTPTAGPRRWFDDDVIDGHLDRLTASQDPDGGWPIAWRPPSEAARDEWRGMRTVAALCVLDAYGRLDRP